MGLFRTITCPKCSGPCKHTGNDRIGGIEYRYYLCRRLRLSLRQEEDQQMKKSNEPVTYSCKLMLPVRIRFVKGTNPAVVRDLVNRMSYGVVGSGIELYFKPKVKMSDCKGVMMFSTQIKGPRQP